ncbi:hypothetical protein LPMP_040680 [Leishmania panamensis]|uniref:Uncharacterized protein n=1 Tax=Leishmania panamensis TaxID=5679 RepID=A0A088RHD5_LEIPA|nr:hypothetical protein LPMP_040680 [Leishmania panamensis]AIN95392.1 hypothetical protein LPMP_040680 [Leishmania panamensis]
MGSHASATAPMADFHMTVDEQQQLLNNAPIHNSLARPDSGDHINDHAHHGTQYMTPLSSPRGEDPADKTTASLAIHGTSEPAPASAVAAVEAPSPGRAALSSLSCPDHYRRRLFASSRHDLDNTVEEFVQRAANDADVPPGLLGFLQRQRQHQPQEQLRQDPQPGLSPLVSTSSVNSVRSVAQTTPPRQSFALPSQDLDSTAACKAATAPMEVNRDDSDVLLHSHNSSGSGGTQVYGLTKLAPSDPSSGLAEEDEEEGTTFSVGGGGGGNGHVRPRLTAGMKTARLLAAPLPKQRHCSSHRMTAPSVNPQSTRELRQLCTSALQRRDSTITGVYQGISSGGGAAASTARCDSTASLMRLQRSHQPVPCTATVSGVTLPVVFRFLAIRSCSQPDSVPRVLPASDSSPLPTTSGNTGRALADHLYEVPGVLRQRVHPPALSTSVIAFPASLAQSSPRGIDTSAGKRFALADVQKPTQVADEKASKGHSCVPLPPLLQLSSVATRASTQSSASAQLFGGATATNATILSSISITDIPSTNLSSSVAAACGRQAPTSDYATRESYSSLGVSYHQQPRFRRAQLGSVSSHSRSAVKPPTAEAAAAAAAGLSDIVTAGSISGRRSSYGETDPSLTAGVVWFGMFSSYAPSVTSPTADTPTSTTNYCYSCASSSIAG